MSLGISSNIAIGVIVLGTYIWAIPALYPSGKKHEKVRNIITMDEPDLTNLLQVSSAGSPAVCHIIAQEESQGMELSVSGSGYNSGRIR